MPYEEGFFLKMKSYIDLVKTGALSHQEFCDQIDDAYAHKQKGKVEIVEICESPEYLEHIAPSIALAQDGLAHLENGFDLLFQYVECSRENLLDAALESFKACTICFNRARDLAFDESEDARLEWQF